MTSSYAAQSRSKSFVSRLLAGACTVALGTMFAGTAASAGDDVKISRASPFASCTADNVARQVGIVYQDSEIEPWIDANPANLDNLIAAWQQDRWSNGGARGLVAGVSVDGGKNWATIVPPGVSVCSGGIYTRASDPWVSIGPTGTAYFMSLAFMEDRPDGGFGQNAMLVSRSVSGGFSWSNPIPLIVETDGQFLDDKNSLTADPLDANYAYAVWDRIQDFTLPKARKAGQAKGAGDGAATARDRYRTLKQLAASGKAQQAPVFFKGPTYFVRTVNGGNSWETPKKIYDPGANAQTINNLVLVRPNGTVVNFFTNISSVGEVHLGLIQSADNGATFGPATLPIPMNVTFTATRTPDDREPVRDANILFDVAVDRANGNLYAVWQDGRFNNLDTVAFSMSTSGGATWSRPVRINMTPHSPVRLRNQAFVPSVEVGLDHKIVVTYYDFRFDTSDGRERTDYFAVVCTPGATTDCRQRSSWGDGTTPLTDIRITDRSFDMLDAPVARGHFLGDYMGLVRKRGVVVPAFGIANSDNHTSINTDPIR